MSIDDYTPCANPLSVSASHDRQAGTQRPVPDISVIIPHYNDVDGLARCLESVLRQDFTGPYEVIVADNGTPGGLGTLPRRFPSVHFLSVPERGAAPARNGAMAVARGRLFAFIDADCIAAPDWLEHGVEALGFADLVGGDIGVTRADALAPTAVECFEQVFAFRQRDYIQKKRFSVTANLFATRAAAEAIGAFRNHVAEDMDWCHRGAALGFRLAFNGKARVDHPARRSWADLARKWDRLIHERWNGCIARGLAARAHWFALSVATALSVGPHLVRVMTSERLETLGEKLKAAGVLIRIRLWRSCKMISLLVERGDFDRLRASHD